MCVRTGVKGHHWQSGSDEIQSPQLWYWLHLSSDGILPSTSAWKSKRKEGRKEGGGGMEEEGVRREGGRKEGGSRQGRGERGEGRGKEEGRREGRGKEIGGREKEVITL